jgi:hypothetical protein
MMTEIKPENLILIKKCLEFYADKENHEKLIPLEKGEFARMILQIIDKVNQENNVSVESKTEEELMSIFLQDLEKLINSQNQ